MRREDTTPPFGSDQLAGFRIGVTSDRRSADLIEALARRGAQVSHAPTVRISHDVGEQAVIADTRAIVEARPEILLATTSYGMRRWLEVADAAGLGVDLVSALGQARILVRGPKACGAIRAAGLKDAGMSVEETTASLVDAVIDRFPAGRTVAVQLHGDPEQSALERLLSRGDRVLTVAPYRWVRSGDERVLRMVDAIAGRCLDCVTFTSAPAVEGLLLAAAALGRERELLAALRSEVVAAAVGPVTAAPLLAVGVVPIQPERYRMGALIRIVCEHLQAAETVQVSSVHGALRLRGSVLTVAETSVQLGPSARALMRVLMAAAGTVVGRRELMQALPFARDEHAIDMAMSRLRAEVGVPGLVRTVVKRGYRIEV